MFVIYIYVHMRYVCVCVCMCIHTRTHTTTHTRTQTRTHAHTHTRTGEGSSELRRNRPDTEHVRRRVAGRRRRRRGRKPRRHWACAFRDFRVRGPALRQLASEHDASSRELVPFPVGSHCFVRRAGACIPPPLGTHPPQCKWVCVYGIYTHIYVYMVCVYGIYT